jgi:sugar-specific transcriptional regulator TrmB
LQKQWDKKNVKFGGKAGKKTWKTMLGIAYITMKFQNAIDLANSTKTRDYATFDALVEQNLENGDTIDEAVKKAKNEFLIAKKNEMPIEIKTKIDDEHKRQIAAMSKVIGRELTPGEKKSLR